jgi:hypothetical protein
VPGRENHLLTRSATSTTHTSTSHDDKRLTSRFSHPVFEFSSSQVEQKDDGARWRGDFTSRYIEDITTKTGNFKKYGVFLKMLLAAIVDDVRVGTFHRVIFCSQNTS